MKELPLIWISTATVVLAVSLFVGFKVRGSLLGVLIDSRNKMSLSQFQLFIWTWLLVSSFFAVAWSKKTMNVDMAPEIWALMGISVGSAAGAIIVKGIKKAKQPDPSRVASSAMQMSRLGVLHTNAAPAKPSWADMFKGEEILDYDYVDISKVQMFFFTIAAWVGYGMILWNYDFVISEGSYNFPELSNSLVTLLGISHAGYLTVKSAPKTPASS